MGFLRKFIKVYFWIIFVWPFIKNKINRFKVMTPVETLRQVKEKGISIVRLGDGEFSYMRGNKHGPSYQPYSDELKNSLLNVLHKRDSRLLISVPRAIQPDHLKSMTKRAQNHWKAFLCINYKFLLNHLDSSYVYGDGLVSRPYMDTKDIDLCNSVFQEFKRVVQDRNLVIIEGEKTRLGIGNDLLESSASIHRILCPAQNSFERINEILNTVFSLYPTPNKRELFLIALGPAAKTITLELVAKGHQVLDIGHFDIEYEWFITRADKKTKIPGKAVSEVKEPLKNNNQLDLTKYTSQIQTKIL